MIKTRLKVGEYEAWLVVENQEVEHYGIAINEETKVSTCWIASTPGKRFGLWVEKPHGGFDCSVEVYLDGSLTRLSSLIGPQPRGLWQDAPIAEKTYRPFIFGVLQSTDDESLISTQSYEELGDIRITVHRVTDARSSQGTPFRLQVPENDKIHERAKKSVTHRVSFGQTIEKLDPDVVTFTRQEKVATFIFHYRSLDILRANGIVRPDPSPAETRATEVEAASSAAADSNGPVSGKRKAEVKEEDDDAENSAGEDSEDEDRRKEADLEAELERVRKARLDRRQGKHVKKKLKSEPKSVFLPGEVIDLTI